MLFVFLFASLPCAPGLSDLGEIIAALRNVLLGVETVLKTDEPFTQVLAVAEEVHEAGVDLTRREGCSQTGQLLSRAFGFPGCKRTGEKEKRKKEKKQRK